MERAVLFKSYKVKTEEKKTKFERLFRGLNQSTARATSMWPATS